MAQAFLPPPLFSRPIVNHINANKLDNRLENLEWTDHQGNFDHAANLGLCNRGINNAAAKITENQVRQIRKLSFEGMKGCEIVRQFSVSEATVCLILKRKTWNHVI